MIPVSVGSTTREERNPDVIVANPKMTELLALAARAAQSDAKVLITGESGVGKDIVAQHVHKNSTRHRAEYIAVNCAGLTETLLESELFGHVRGSFTGAYRDKPGKLQMAHRGTLFLDEVGEMSLRMQALLLRFLENGEIQAVGSDKAQARVDVRVIAATNRDLSELVGSGHFREDLLYRLRVIHLHVPPLRERREDVVAIAEFYLKQSKRNIRLSPAAWEAMERYRWPGNVRELHNVIEQIVWLALPGEMVEVAQLPKAVQAGQAILPARERRRQLADDLYHALVSGGYSFWDHIHPLFLARDITRHDLRELIRRGLSVCRGNYRSLLQLFRIPKSDYKRFMNFLASHDCGVDYREFRNPHAEPGRAPRVVLPALLAPGDAKAAQPSETARSSEKEKERTSHEAVA